ncbi:MAG: hypothetical protein R6X13_07595 [bacterium]
MHVKRSAVLTACLLSAITLSAALGQTFVSTITLPDTFGFGNAPRGLVANHLRGEVYCGGDYPGGVLFISDSTAQKTGFTRAGTNIVPLCVRPNGQWLFVSHYNSRRLSVIDVTTRTVIRSASLGSNVVAAACRPDGNRVYGVLSSGASLAFLDPAGDSTVGYIPLLSRPVSLALDSTGQKLYLPLPDTNRLAVVNSLGDSVLRYVRVGARPHAAAWRGATGRLYVARYGSDSLAVIDCAADTILRYVAVGDSPVGFAVNPVLNRVYCLNYKTRTVSVIDGANDSVIATVPVGNDPRSIACSPLTGRVYCANNASYSVTVIDGATNTVVRTPLVGIGPVEVACCPQSGRAYVVRAAEAAISIIGGPSDTVIGLVTTVAQPVALALDVTRGKVWWLDELNGIAGSVTMPSAQSTANVPLPSLPVAAVHNPANDRLYVACDAAGRVAVIDPANDSLLALIPVGASPRRLCLRSDGSRVYSTNSGGNSVSVIDATADTVIATVPVGATPFALRHDPVRDRLLVVNSSGSSVTVVNCTTNTVVATITVGTYPYDVALAPLSGRAYVPSSGTDSVAVIDLAANTKVRSIAVPNSPTRALYNPTDNRLYVACYAAESVAVIDCAAESLVATVRVRTPAALALSKHGRVWCASDGHNSVSVINPGANRRLITLQTGDEPLAIVADSASGLVYTANYSGYTLSAFKDHAVDVAAVSANVNASYDPLDTVVPTGTWANYSVGAVDFDAWLSLRDPLGRLVYSEHRYVTGLAAGRDTTLTGFPGYVLRTPGNWVARCSTRCTGDSVRADDVVSTGFTVTGTGVLGWAQHTPMPLAPSGRAVKEGGWLATGPDGTIYAAKGYKTGDFFGYAPLGDSWQTLTSIPPGLEGRPPYKGACAASDNNRYIYAVKGNSRFGFYRYDMVDNSWLEREPVPGGISGKKPKGGTEVAFVQRGDTGFVYLLKGRTYEFWRYNTVANSWTALPDAPMGTYKWKDGTWLVAVGDTAVYTHKANRHEFWRYDILAGAWSPTALAPMPLLNFIGRNKRSKAGGCAALWGDRIMALKGGNTQELWEYSLTGNTWTELETIPSLGITGRKKRIKGGADIVNVGNWRLYALKGNKTVELWSYTPVSLGLAAKGSRPDRDGVQAEAANLRPASALQVEQNPARGGAVVHLAGPPTEDPSLLTLHDAAGRVVLSAPVGGRSRVPLDLSRLAPGVYFVRLGSSTPVGPARLVLMR